MKTFVRASILISCGALVAGLLALASGTSVEDAAVVVALAAAGGRCGRARCGYRCLLSLSRRW